MEAVKVASFLFKYNTGSTEDLDHSPLVPSYPLTTDGGTKTQLYIQGKYN